MGSNRIVLKEFMHWQVGLINCYNTQEKYTRTSGIGKQFAKQKLERQVL